MKFLLIALVAVVLVDPIKINRINKLKATAKNAFQSGDYKGAAETYRLLVDSLGVREDEVLLNLAHANYLMKDTASAFSTYQSLTQSKSREIASKAHQQLGVMTNQRGKAEEALSYFKQAIKSDPANESARYDYEMLKKKLDEQKKKQQQPNQNNQENKDQQKQDQQKNQDKKDEQQKQQNEKDQENQDQQNKDEQQKKDQQNKDQQNKDQQKKDQEQKEQEQQQQNEQKDQKQKDQNKNMNLDPSKLPKISPEKAQMILEAMRNQEKQYLQQNKRKPTKSRDRNKPDW